MSKSIISMIPDWNDLVRLEPEELAGVLIVHMNSLTAYEQQNLNRHNFWLGGEIKAYPTESHENVSKALSEAWAWLERDCLVAPMPGRMEGWAFITRRGQKLVDLDAYEAYRRASALPRALLDPRIDAHCYPSFLRGAYDTAVFEAMREVEVAVRNAAGWGPERYGRQLMLDAFAPTTGPLSDKQALRTEQEGMMFLFAGAIGLYKNPSSHQSNVITEPTVAAEIIMLASHLLKIVDSRTPATSPSP